VIAAVPAALVNVAATLALFAGIAASLAAIAKTPAGKVLRWCWKRLVAEPLNRWAHETIGEVAEERVVKVLMKPNGGKSLHDLAAVVNRIERRQVRIESHLGLSAGEQESAA